jgi:Fe2+ or Zn2+ uptake regulation protein
MNDFEKLKQADMRLVILLVLAQDADYSHNEYVLREALRAMGHGVSQDKLRTELAWLAEQGLLSIAITAGTRIAKLTVRGKDVTEGVVVVPGVKRPEPEA